MCKLVSCNANDKSAQTKFIQNRFSFLFVKTCIFISGFFSSKTPLKNRSTIFSLGSRGQVLTDLLEEPIIVPHAAQKTDKRVSVNYLYIISTKFNFTIYIYIYWVHQKKRLQISNKFSNLEFNPSFFSRILGKNQSIY